MVDGKWRVQVAGFSLLSQACSTKPVRRTRLWQAGFSIVEAS